MKSTGEYLAILRSFMQKHATKYGILSMGIFGSVARGNNAQTVTWMFLSNYVKLILLLWDISVMNWKLFAVVKSTCYVYDVD